jgi:hypothetical protein
MKMISKSYLSRLTLVFVAFLAGCSSISGYKLNNDGDPKSVSGMPITVKTPKKALFFITKSTYEIRQLSVGDDGTVTMGAATMVSEMEVDKTPVYLGPTETYTIDPKRPAFGTIDYGMEFTEQYPSKITGKVDDKTLDKLDSLIQGLAGELYPHIGTVQKQSGAAETIQKTLVSREVLIYEVDLASGVGTLHKF